MFSWLEQGLEYVDAALVQSAGGASPLFGLGLAALLGLRHAGDPDHVAAVAEIVADKRRPPASAAMLGFAWGSGHAVMLLACGLAMMTMNWVMPPAVHRGSEKLVGAVILALAVRLMWRWMRPGKINSRFPFGGRRGAFAVGGLHGLAGSGAVALLLLAALPDRKLAMAALVIFALGAMLAMALCAVGIRSIMQMGSFGHRYRQAGMLAFCGLNISFGLWYMCRA